MERKAFETMVQKIIRSFKNDVVLTASLCLAAVSCFIIPPNAGYIDYIDFHTLITLFCLMLIMEGLRELNFLQDIGNRILKKVTTQRGIASALVFLCFISSMLITNDVSLITFVPFGIMILEMAGMTGRLCLTVTLMTIASNLGSMFTPIGNPQNLYLYSLSDLSIQEFLLLTGPCTAASAALLACFLLASFRSDRLTVHLSPSVPLNASQTGFYLLLFLLCVLAVAGFIPHVLLFVLVAAALLWKNRKLFVKIDYSLLLTFTFFFIFVGNMKQIESLRLLIVGFLENHDKLFSIFLSQVISNVPAAMLLSGYSTNISELIIGTNLGGLGTLIASMASLISYKQLCLGYPHLKKKYIGIFTLYNLFFLAVLYGVTLV